MRILRNYGYHQKNAAKLFPRMLLPLLLAAAFVVHAHALEHSLPQPLEHAQQEEQERQAPWLQITSPADGAWVGPRLGVEVVHSTTRPFD